MTQSTQYVKNEFSSGLQLGPFVTSSGILLRSWSAITSSNHASTNSNVGVGLSWKVLEDSDNDLTIIAFEAATVSNLQPDWVPYSDFKYKNFKFLGTEKSPFFYVNFNKAAVDLFYDNHLNLNELKSQIITSSTPLIVTGQALGGSIAILFTLSILDSIDLGKKRPLCITFGSPLLGDKELQRAVSRSSAWNSCFLHVVSHKDPLPRQFITDQTSAAAGTQNEINDYVPFGTYLFCYDTNSTCSENPASILELLKAMSLIHDQNKGFQSAEYGDIVKNLYRKAICNKDLTAHGENMICYSSLHASNVLQLQALGLTQNMQQQQQQHSTLVAVMERLEKEFINHKRSKYEASSKLNESKINIAQLEWYRKDSKNRNIGYYDGYKKEYSASDQDAITFHRKLRHYWKNLVEEAELKPQVKDAVLRTRWLYGGTNYRRMVEPLDIAEYYRNGGKDYVNKGRSRHYKQLEELLEESLKAATSDSNSNCTDKKEVEYFLTYDSCFWAHVEEALLLNKLVKDEKFSSVAQKEEAMQKLIEFEDYVYGLLKKCEVSSEIFLDGSSYMFWWNEYKEIDGVSNDSNLARFMSNTDNYKVRYVERTFDFS